VLNLPGMTATPARPTAPVLVVEDEPDIRALLVGLLEADGYRALSAAEGGEALRLLQTMPVLPCLILLDLMMPGMNGFEFRTAQRRDKRLASVPVVVLTAYGQSLDGARLGDVDLLQKPIDLDVLLALIESRSARAVETGSDAAG
jgi:CheY-like chemotaxis protein